MKSKTFTGLVILGIVGVGAYLYLKNRNKGVGMYEESPNFDDVYYTSAVPSTSKKEVVRKSVVKKVKSSPSTKLNVRQEKLVTVLKRGSGLTTTDILKSIPSTTDRTLRRDLNKLIELGVVKKSGSTKSSKYYIKK